MTAAAVVLLIYAINLSMYAVITAAAVATAAAAAAIYYVLHRTCSCIGRVSVNTYMHVVFIGLKFASYLSRLIEHSSLLC